MLFLVMSLNEKYCDNPQWVLHLKKGQGFQPLVCVVCHHFRV